MRHVGGESLVPCRRIVEPAEQSVHRLCEGQRLGRKARRVDPDATLDALGAFDRLDATSGAIARLGKAVGVTAIVYGAVLIVGAAAGNDDPLGPLRILPSMSTANTSPRSDPRVASLADFDTALLATSHTPGHPVLVSFTADWCTVCKSNEAVMAEPAVRARLETLPAIVVDVTAHNEATRALMARFAVVGPPTLLLVDGQGREQ